MGLAELYAGIDGGPGQGVLDRDASIDAVWQHIGDCLIAMAKKSGPKQLTQNEPGLNQRLMKELEGRLSRLPCFFHPEYMEDQYDGQSRKIDFAAVGREGAVFVVDGIRFADREPFLALEAKRLPTPGTKREREYVVGKLGGVSRFKRGQHARSLRACLSGCCANRCFGWPHSAY